MTEKQLADELNNWFNNKKDYKNRLNNPVGRIIKQKVSEWNNWRNAPRGNPSLGYRKMKEKKLETLQE